MMEKRFCIQNMEQEGGFATIKEAEDEALKMARGSGGRRWAVLEVIAVTNTRPPELVRLKPIRGKR